MYRETNARVELDKEVELAAVVQETFVPSQQIAKLGAVKVSGTYAPASRCGGDWWSAHALDDGRVLVLIGDVTGHGVAAAMVTAAAKGCYDVALRLMGNNVDVVQLLQLLHTAVRRTGGDEFHMTCFATLIDPERETITFANAGHVVPYICRTNSSGKATLGVLVARGNPLGASEEAAEYKAHTKPIRSGDMLVWYTDGIVECSNVEGKQFGDRRFQRALKQMTTRALEVDAFRDQMVRQALSFLSGHPADDDITLVVGKLSDKAA
jgi:serine phosphatase RsbU (regulator of sigma subunit)